MAVFFYTFAGLIILSSVLVISTRNPVHAVLWLIFAFCNGAGLMVLAGAEFIAMMLIIIYVGAVAVLFLFVVMMLDIKFTEFKGFIGHEMGATFFIAFLLLVDIILIICLASKFVVPGAGEIRFQIPQQISNAHAIGNLLYTTFIVPFQISGVILFVAMISTISLTLRLRPGVKRQKVAIQMKRNKENSLVISDMNCKNGLGGLNYED